MVEATIEVLESSGWEERAALRGSLVVVEATVDSSSEDIWFCQQGLGSGERLGVGEGEKEV